MDEIYEVIGVDVKKGEYQGHPYENVNLLCRSTAKGSIAGCSSVRSLKIKKADWSKIVEGFSPEEMYGKKITPYNNSFQQIAKIVVVK